MVVVAPEVRELKGIDDTVAAPPFFAEAIIAGRDRHRLRACLERLAHQRHHARPLVALRLLFGLGELRAGRGVETERPRLGGRQGQRRQQQGGEGQGCQSVHGRVFWLCVGLQGAFDALALGGSESTCLVCHQPGLQGFDINVLHRGVGANGRHGRDSGRVAEVHVLRLHAQRPVGHVRGRKADRHQQVGALLLVRRDAPVGNLIRLDGAHVEVSLVDDVALGGHQTLVGVGIENESSHGDGIRLGILVLAVLLAHDVAADHPARFPDIEGMRPVAVVDKLITAKAPALGFLAQFRRNPLVVAEEPQQALHVIDMVLIDAGARGLVALGVIGVAAPVVGAEDQAGGVDLAFATGDPADIHDPRELDARIAADQLDQQVVTLRVVVLGLRKGHQVVFVARDDDTKGVALHELVAGAEGGPGFVGDTPEKLAGGIAGRELAGCAMRVGGAGRGHIRHIPWPQGRGQEAGERLAIFISPFASDRVFDTGPRHEIALIGRIHKHLAAIRGAVLGRERHNPVALTGHGLQELLLDDADPGLVDHLLEGRHGDVRLALPKLERRGGFLRVVILGVGPGEELPGDSADGLLLAGIGGR